MAEQNKIFRKVALERLASPDQIDQLLRVTSPKGWVALLALCAVLVVAIFWGVFGSLSSTVNGTCILIRSGGVFTVEAPASGILTDLAVEVGDLVHQGQLVARIEQPEMLQQIAVAQARLRDLRARRTILAQFADQGKRLDDANLARQKRHLESRILTSESKVKALAGKMAVREVLLQKGLLTKQELLNTKLEYAAARQEIESARIQIEQLRIQALQSQKQSSNELAMVELDISNMERTLSNLRTNDKQMSLVLTPYTGRVIEIRVADEGSMVAAGTTLLALELIGKNVGGLEATVFVSPMDGQKLKMNMDVQVSPSTVKREESGFMLGKVRTVSGFPSSRASLIRLLGNDQLVQLLMAGGAPIQVEVDLIPDAKTKSGYKWSSPKGPEIEIESGTFCSAGIITERRRPITLVIPLLRAYLSV